MDIAHIPTSQEIKARRYRLGMGEPLPLLPKPVKAESLIIEIERSPPPATTPQAWVRRQKEIWFKILSDRPVARHAVTIADIQHVVAQRFDVTRADLISARRTAKLVHPRMIAFYLAKKITPHSLPKIGRAFGGRDHSTALHSIRTIDRRLKDDQALRELIASLEAQLGGPYEPTDSDQ